jgi:hypothetical protein
VQQSNGKAAVEDGAKRRPQAAVPEKPASCLTWAVCQPAHPLVELLGVAGLGVAVPHQDPEVSAHLGLVSHLRPRRRVGVVRQIVRQSGGIDHSEE